MIEFVTVGGAFARTYMPGKPGVSNFPFGF
jgi:hypothetical protein